MKSIQIDLEVGEEDYEYKLTGTKFEKMALPYFKRCIDKLGPVLSEAKYGKKDIEVVIMVGGSTRIPLVRRMVSEYFDNKVPLYNQFNLELIVAQGDAVYADSLSKELSNLTQLERSRITKWIQKSLIQ